jgi:hypothetical protein
MTKSINGVKVEHRSSAERGAEKSLARHSIFVRFIRMSFKVITRTKIIKNGERFI